MGSIVALWLPILVSAVFVFVVSSIIHMALRYHSNDFARVPREDELMAATRPLEIPAGEYMVPRAASMKAMKEPEFQAKLKAGPVLLMTVFPSGDFKMGAKMLLWFLYSVLVGIFAAYVAGHAIPVWMGRRAVVRYVGVTAFAGYSLALLQTSIWWGRRWSTTLKSMFDGLIYALVTAATFVWLWPMH